MCHVCVSGRVDVRVLFLTFSLLLLFLLFTLHCFTNVLVSVISFCHCISSGGLDKYVKLCLFRGRGEIGLSTVPQGRDK